MMRTIKTLGQAAGHGMLVRSRCRKCNKVARFTAGSLAGMFGHGHEIRSLKFKCKDCSSTDCEVLLYEVFKSKVKPQPVQELQVLAQKLGRDHSAMHKDLAPKLKCSACGSKQIGLSSTPY